MMENNVNCMSFEDFKNYTLTKPEWQRAQREGIDNALSDITFQVFDVTAYSTLQVTTIHERQDKTFPSLSGDGIRLFGVTESGYSICVNVHGYTSYFYASLPDTFSLDDLQSFKDLVNRKFREEMDYNFDIVISMEKANLEGVAMDTITPLIKCCVRAERYIEQVVRILRREMALIKNGFELCTFEEEVGLVSHFLMDRKIRGCSWLSINSDKLVIVAPALRQSTCQLELEVFYQNLVCIDSVPTYELKTAVPKIFGFDIECFVRKNIFSHWSVDPVITIACVIRDGYRKTEDQIKVIFVLGTCVKIKDAEVFCFNSEEELLRSWVYFLQFSDPDIIVGYNVISFDFNYLLSRGNQLKIEGYGNFGRLKKAPGPCKDYNVTGRVILDLLPITKTECPGLSSYALVNVSKILLNDSKEDLDVNCMGQLHEGTDSDRGRIASYCLKDTLLPLQLVDHLGIFEKYTQVASVSGLQLKSVTENSRKIFDASSIPLLQSAHQYGCTIRKKTVEEGNSLPVVVTPETLALYACIIMEFNLCYRTYLPKEKALNLPADAFNKTPCGSYFLSKQNRKGVVPFTFAKLLGQIQTVRVKIKNQKDSGKLRLLFCRLRALKNTLRAISVMLQSPHSSYYFFPIHSAINSYSKSLSQEEKMLLQKKYFR